MKKNLVKMAFLSTLMSLSLSACATTSDRGGDEVTLVEDTIMEKEVKVDEVTDVSKEEVVEELEVNEVEVKNEESEITEEKNERPVIIGMPNPFYTFDNLEEASKIAGFSIALPLKAKLPSWVHLTVYRPTKTNLLEVIYSEDDSYQREIRIRKALTDKEDISGDYRSYDSESAFYINGILCNIRMNGDVIYEAYWHNNEYSYSLHVTDGLAEEDLIEMVKIIK